MIRLEITAEAVAWYAAIVATFSVLVAAASGVVAAYSLLRDRAKLRVELKPNMKVFPAEPEYDKNKVYIMVRVVNAGRRPATVTHVWLEPRQKGAASMVFADCVKRGSQELTEGKSATYLAEQDAVDLQMFRYFCVCDSTGRTYRKRITRRVRKAVESGGAEQPSRREGQYD